MARRLPDCLVRDLRILFRALGCKSPEQAQLCKLPAARLFDEVVGKTSALAKGHLGALCDELIAEASGDANHVSSRLPQCEMFASSVGPPLGVRVSAAVAPGELLCVYPGRIFLADEQNLPQSDKLYANDYEGVYLDGKGWLPAAERGGELLKDQHDAGVFWHQNRMAIGNILNHSPAGAFPNCIPIVFRWPTWQALGHPSPAFWGRVLPHCVMREGQVVRTPSGETSAGPLERKVLFPPWPHMGVAFVSVVPINAGDELFWNYRLQPRRASTSATLTYPSWYAPVEEEEFERYVASLLS
eukprot:TRINITY_DN30554_c0_g1_i1.p1 TRINITY_DN30554_c0_g1~~TRINITY_DN30554_c0_g1_i1.p1  ORF type:complete len:300 (+),score=40.51 TRINITY_DN30554_c0_g1_i1:56-955(+)